MRFFWYGRSGPGSGSSTVLGGILPTAKSASCRPVHENAMPAAAAATLSGARKSQKPLTNMPDQLTKTITPSPR